MFKNVASQKVTFLVIDTAANAPKTGDAANLTAYVSKDDGAVTVLADTSATELDATNAPGLYSFDLAQAETAADKLLFSGKSTTANVRVIPLLVYTRANNVNDLVIDATGNLTANVTGNLSGSVASVTGNVAGSVGSVAAGGIAAASIADGAITEAKIATPAEAAGIPTGVLAMVRRLFEWRARKRTRNRTTGVVTLRNAADTGNLESYTQSTAGTTDTEGASA